MEAAQAKEEVKKLKSKMGGLNPRISELEAEVCRNSSPIYVIKLHRILGARASKNSRP